MSQQKQSVRLVALVSATGLAIAVGVGVAMHQHSADPAQRLPDAAAARPADTSTAAEPPARKVPERSAPVSSLGQRPIDASSPDTTETRLEKLEELVGDIAQEQRQLTAVIARLTAGETGAESERAAALSPAERAELADQQAADQASHISETHLEEAVDPEWAPEAQEKVHAMFTNEALEGFTLTSADCRASLCRVEMGLDEAMPGPEAFRKLQQNTPWDGAGFVEITLDPPAAVLYLAREGASIPEMSDSTE